MTSTDSAPSTPWVVSADDQTFQQIAVERSRSMLVVVDFWAEWCQPCRLLGPLLEKLAADYDGRFLLVKVETEKAPSIAAGFGVQSIPAVYALRDGQLIDFFVGLLPEGQLRAWLDRQLPTPAETLVVAGRAAVSTNPALAETKFREAIAADPNLAPAKIHLAELLLNQGRTDESAVILAELNDRGFLEPEAETLQARLHMAAQSDKADHLDELRAAAADPKNLTARLELAQGLAAAGQYPEALETALAIVQTGKREFVEPARVLMVDLFRVLDEIQPELVTDYRRRLSTALY